MKTLRQTALTGAMTLALLVIPAQKADAFWLGSRGPGYGGWRHAYVHHPAYRWGGPWQKSYIRDLYLRGPAYAQWRQLRRHGYWW